MKTKLITALKQYWAYLVLAWAIVSSIATVTYAYGSLNSQKAQDIILMKQDIKLIQDRLPATFPPPEFVRENNLDHTAIRDTLSQNREALARIEGKLDMLLRGKVAVVKN